MPIAAPIASSAVTQMSRIARPISASTCCRDSCTVTTSPREPVSWAVRERLSRTGAPITIGVA